MSRKDTILVAVLINAGLLIVLFATALKPKLMEEHYTAMQRNHTPVQHEIIAPKPDIGPTPIAEVKPLPVPALPPEPKKEVSSFADDLNAFAMEKAVVKEEPKKAPPSPPSPAPVKSESSFRTVVVKQGDFLEKIAKRNGTTVNQLMRDNNLHSTTLQIGQKLKISTTGEASSSTASTAAAEYYTVQNGDNPWTIAKKNGIRVSELLKLNDLDDYAAKRLKPGDKLRIK